MMMSVVVCGSSNRKRVRESLSSASEWIGVGDARNAEPRAQSFASDLPSVDYSSVGGDLRSPGFTVSMSFEY